MKISVTLANYNHGRFLETYFAGIRGQTYKNWELIVTDDGSTDNSREIIRRHAAEDSRIKVFEFPENRGSMPAFYNCYAHATGDFIYATASDDYLVEPRFFAKAIAAFRRHPRMGIFFGTEEIRDAVTDKIIGRDGRAPVEGLLTPRACAEAFLKKQLMIPGVCAILRKDYIDEFGGYPKDLAEWCDYYIHHSIPLKYGAYFSRELFSCARLDPKGGNLSLKTPLDRRFANIHEVFRRLLRDGLLDKASPELLAEGVNREVQLHLAWTHGCMWTLERLKKDIRVAQTQSGFRPTFLQHLSGDNLRAIESEQQFLAERILNEVDAFDARMRRLIPGYRTKITGRNHDDVFAFMTAMPVVPEQISQVLREHAPVLKRFRRVVLYGAGGHSEILLAKWKRLGLPPFEAATSSDANAAGNFHGIPVIPLTSLKARGALFVLSSHSFEPDMHRKLTTHFPRCRVLSIWNPHLTKL